MTREQQLAEGMKALGLDLPADVQERLLAYAAFLEKWNRTYSLTALRDPKLAVSHHLLDSLAIMPYVSASTLLDVGSGGGQPGIPLAIARPDLAVTLLDSNGKKTAFLQQAVIELGLKNVQVVTVRVEEFKPAAPFARWRGACPALWDEGLSRTVTFAHGSIAGRTRRMVHL